MKRSRIFLGLTTACLAIAGVVAAKATHFNNLQRWYITVTGNCVLQPGVDHCVYSPEGIFTAFTILSGIPHFLFTQVNVLGVCTNPLKFDIFE